MGVGDVVYRGAELPVSLDGDAKVRLGQAATQEGTPGKLLHTPLSLDQCLRHTTRLQGLGDDLGPAFFWGPKSGCLLSGRRRSVQQDESECREWDDVRAHHQHLPGGEQVPARPAPRGCSQYVSATV